MDSLIALSGNVVSTGIKKISDMPEFIRLAKTLKISRIKRSVYVGLSLDSNIIYEDNSFEGIYSKEYCRVTPELRICYDFQSEYPFEKGENGNNTLYELLSNILSLGYSTSYRLEEERMKQDIDHETGIPNIKAFNRFYATLLTDGFVTDYALIRANIKGCNLLNNLYGYYTTTEIINKFAKFLNDCMEDDEICARNNGDNFCMLCKKENLKRHLRSFSAVPVDISVGQEKVELNIAVRAGVVEINEDIYDCGTLTARAESCLEVAKRREGTDVVYYDKAAIRRELELTLLESEMPAALINNEFKVYFQPKVQVDTRTMIGAEALIRWQRKEKLISPSEFIPVAERTGFIKKLDLFVLEHTCRLIRRWQDEGVEVVPVSVNFSKMHLRFPHFAEKIMKIIDRYEIEPRLIEIEFTETAYIDDFNAIKRAIADLKEHGVIVSMDDFGTGYSSLALLKDLNFDVLKLDKSLAGNKTDERGLVVLENVLHMANELKLVTVCEGVEEKENVDHLKDMGCNIIQGFYFDKPLPEKEFYQRLINPIYSK